MVVPLRINHFHRKYFVICLVGTVPTYRSLSFAAPSTHTHRQIINLLLYTEHKLKKKKKTHPTVASIYTSISYTVYQLMPKCKRCQLHSEFYRGWARRGRGVKIDQTLIDKEWIGKALQMISETNDDNPYDTEPHFQQSVQAISDTIHNAPDYIRNNVKKRRLETVCRTTESKQ